MKQKAAISRHRFSLILGVCSLLPMVIALVTTNQTSVVQKRSTAQAAQHIRELERLDRLTLSMRSNDEEAFNDSIDDLRLAASGDEVQAASRMFVDENLRVIEAAYAILRAERATFSHPRRDQAAHAATNAVIALRRHSRAKQLESVHAVAAQMERVKRSELALLALAFLAFLGFVTYRHRAINADIEAEKHAAQLDALRRRNESLEGAIEGIATFDATGRYTWANSNFARIVGYESEELIGSDIRASLLDLEADDVLRAETELRTHGRVTRDVSVRRKDFSTAFVRVVMVSRRAADGGFVFIEDVTEQKKTEQELRLSHERFRQAMRATRDLVTDWNLLNDEVWVNEAMHTTLGYPEDMTPSLDDIVEMIHPDDLTRALVHLHEALNDGSDSITEEYRLRRFDGTYAYVFVRCSILRDETGRPLRMISALSDITSRHNHLEEIQRLESQMRNILASTADGLYGVDAQGRTTFVNPAAIRILGWTEHDLSGRVLHDIAHRTPDGKSAPLEECSLHQTLMTGKPVGGKGQYFTKDGRTLAVEFTCQPMHNADGAITGAVVTFRDITERVAVERMKDEFISVVSHELRTPLTAIRGALGLMAGGRAGEVPEKMKRMLDIGVTNTDRLVRLINDILDIERIDSGKITLSRTLCNASDAIADAIEAIKPIADAAGVCLAAEPSHGVLFADRDRLHQTLTNLIGNAVKFSPRATTVHVAATAIGTDVRFSVSDQGRGIPKDRLQAIFERFQQVDATDSREKGGSGLGLAICRSIVRQHGGEIWAESEPGQGSQFIFTLPRVQRASTPLPQNPSRTILVCEDDDIIREVEVELLEQAGYRTLGFATGNELLASGLAKTADVILMDMGLPGLSGAQVVERLRQSSETREVPVVIVSGSPQQDALDVAAWLCKPLQEGELLREVESAMRETPARPRLLLVEDDLDLARVIIESFDRLDIQVCHAATGRQALELTRDFRPELIILDLVLPEVDGFGVVAEMRRDGRLASVPLVVYSASEPNAAERERLRLGQTEFFTKSRISPEEFESHVIRLLDTIVGGEKELSNVA